MTIFLIVIPSESLSVLRARALDIARRIRDHFDFRLAAIVRDFDLRHLPRKTSGRFYQCLAAYGHFGRTDLKAPWERTDRRHLLLEA